MLQCAYDEVINDKGETSTALSEADVREVLSETGGLEPSET